MRRSSTLVFVVLGAALAGFLFSSTAIQLEDEEPPPTTSAVAGPQRAALDWRETFGPPGQELVFEVKWLQVLEDGWRVKVRLENGTDVAYEVGDPQAALDRAFGLMLFTNGELAELDRRNRSGTLPTTRSATRYQPRLPLLLEPGASWEGTLSAPGSLVAGSYVRVVFGTLLAVGATGEGLEEQVIWITDHAYRLKR